MLTGRILSKVTIMSKQKYTDSNGKRKTGSAYVRLPNSRAQRGEAKPGQRDEVKPYAGVVTERRESHKAKTAAEVTMVVLVSGNKRDEETGRFSLPSTSPQRVCPEIGVKTTAFSKIVNGPHFPWDGWGQILQLCLTRIP